MWNHDPENVNAASQHLQPWELQGKLTEPGHEPASPTTHNMHNCRKDNPADVQPVVGP